MDSNPSTRWLATDIESQPELGPESEKNPAEAWTSVETTAHSSGPKKRKLGEMIQPSCNTDSNELRVHVPNIQAVSIALENYDDHSNESNRQLLDRLLAYIRHLERNNEALSAELEQTCKQAHALKHSNRRFRAQRSEVESSLHFELQSLERLNRHLQAELRKDADEHHRMKQSIRKLRRTCGRLRTQIDCVGESMTRFRDALDALTDNNLLPAVCLHRNGQLEEYIPEHRRQQVGQWVNTAYALWLQDQVDSANSTEEEAQRTLPMSPASSVEL